MNKTDEPILIAGAGYMAIEYAKVLKAMKKKFIAVCRSEESAEEFEKQIGEKALTGGLEKYLLSTKELPNTAIVAISEEQLGSATRLLINKGIKNILVEKPAGLDFADIKKVAKLANVKKAKIYVGYNRRFYASVEKAQEIIKKDGGVLSMHFDFTEAVHKITPLIRAAGVKENWFIQNSTHVIDLAFFLGGTPVKINSSISGSLNWHPAAAVFAGSGKTNSGALFSYHSDWQSAGRWSVEIMTKKHKLFFMPLEKLKIQEIGSFEVRDFLLQDKIDTEFKAGVYKETESFLTDQKDLCTIDEQEDNLKYYSKILKG